jgi:hypothetical protein
LKLQSRQADANDCKDKLQRYDEYAATFFFSDYCMVPDLRVWLWKKTARRALFGAVF